MGLLEQLTSPADLRDLTDTQLEALAAEIRDELVRTCAPRGGHLGPNLGVVELTLGIHRVFDSPRDRVVWDTGHQGYVQKMLTGRATKSDRVRARGRPPHVPKMLPGRATEFHTLLTEAGLSGCPSQYARDHAIVENSHAST